MVIAAIALIEVVSIWAGFHFRTSRVPLPNEKQPPASSAIPAPSDTSSSDADIERALALARRGASAVGRGASAAGGGAGAIVAIDSSAIKSAWHEQVRGADLSGLSASHREVFLRFANAERCTCGCGYTLAGCLASDMTCEVSGTRVAELLDSIRTGRIRDAHGIRRRPRRH